jgi:hypothetical protein
VKSAFSIDVFVKQWSLSLLPVNVKNNDGAIANKSIFFLTFAVAAWHFHLAKGEVNFQINRAFIMNIDQLPDHVVYSKSQSCPNNYLKFNFN